MKKRILYNILNEWRDEDIDDTPIDIDDDIDLEPISSDMSDEPDLDDDDFILSTTGNNNDFTHIITTENGVEMGIRYPKQEFFFNMYDVLHPFRRTPHKMKDLKDTWSTVLSQIIEWYKFYQDNSFGEEFKKEADDLRNIIHKDINNLGIYCNYDLKIIRVSPGEYDIKISANSVDFFKYLAKNVNAPFSQEYTKDSSARTLTEIGKGFMKNPSYEKLKNNVLNVIVHDEDNNEIGKCKLGGIIFGTGNVDYPHIIIPNFMIDRGVSAEIKYDIYFRRYKCYVYIYFTKPIPYANIPLENMDNNFFQKSDKKFNNCSSISDLLNKFIKNIDNKFYYETNYKEEDDEKLVINLDEMMKNSAKFFTFMNKLTHRWCFQDEIVLKN